MVHLQDAPESGCTTSCALCMLMLLSSSLVTKYPSSDIDLFMTRPVTWSLWKSLQGVSYLPKELDDIPLMQEALLQHTRCTRLASEHCVIRPSNTPQPWRLWLDTRWRNYNMYKSWVHVWSKLPMTLTTKAWSCGVHEKKANGDASNALLVNARNSSSDVIQYWRVFLIHFDTWQT